MSNKPLHGEFEDELGILVDRYLMGKADLDWMRRILTHEARYLEDRRKELEERLNDVE